MKSKGWLAPRFPMGALFLVLLFLGPERKLKGQNLIRGGPQPFTVVLDAGHGGKDPGAVGKQYHEKNLTLAIAKAVADSLAHYDPAIKVVLTRRTDTFIELRERAAIAQRAKGDFFVSIHCNALRKKDRKGVETYILGINEGQENYETIIAENEAMLFEKNYQEIYGGFDPSSPEGFIYLKLIKNVFRQESLLMANQLQKIFTNQYKRLDRGVKQAPFIVLYLAGMPAILTEVGFISNPEEEIYLGSEKGQSEIASAICQSILSYIHTLNR